MKSARMTVYKLLLKMEYNAYSTLSLNGALQNKEFDNTEKAFITRLFYGVIERKITLDFYISRYSKKPLEKLDKEVLIILRMGLFQILYMDSVPDNAAVNEAVELTKKIGKTSASGLVNAVLRGVIREGKLPEFIYKNNAEMLSVKYSCNLSIVESLLHDYGQENTIDLLSSALDDKHKQTTHKSSMLCVSALNVKQGDVVLDVCAAPGGKTLKIAELIGENGTAYACDISGKRLDLIKIKAEKKGFENIIYTQNNGRIFNSNLPMFDKILCDVPCSGLGTISAKPEIKYHAVSELDELPKIQAEILNTSAKYLKIGGDFVYSTCTLRKAENDNIIDEFLRENTNFEGVKFLTETGEPFGDYKATIFPKHFQSGGFFISKIMRKR